MNSIVLIGRLTRDAEMKYTNSGTAISNFSLAVDKSYKKGEQKEVNFFDIVLWGKVAESLNQYLTKGKQIAVQGELDQQRWQSSEGQNRSKIIINAKNVQLLGGQKQNNFEDEIPFD